jgi:hypothetical protein
MSVLITDDLLSLDAIKLFQNALAFSRDRPMLLTIKWCKLGEKVNFANITIDSSTFIDESLVPIRLENNLYD